MALEYLPIMAQNSASKAPRVLAKPSKFAWCVVSKPLIQSRVALLTSAALRLETQRPFVPREDLSYRRVPSDPAIGPLVIDHHSGIGTVPKQDPEIVFPRIALAGLLSRGLIGNLSPQHFSFMGGVRQHAKVEQELAPALGHELLDAQVDLALLVPYWPFCHETVGLISHVIEALSIPTLVIGTAYDIMSSVVPPRAAFVDHPVGRTFGAPHDRERNVAILAKALTELPQFTQPGMIRDLHCNWASDGSRSWEEELRAEMRREH